MGHAQLMDPVQQAKFDAALPKLSNVIADDALHGRLPGKRLFYTSDEMPHLQQDFVGGSMHFHQSTKNRADKKVQDTSASDFEFPWRSPGGTDNANTFTFKVKFLPEGTIIRVHRADLPSYFDTENRAGTFSRTRPGIHQVSGYDWHEPVGTRNFEIICFGDRLLSFEVRVRTKVAEDRWVANLYRPFTRDDFANVANIRPDPLPILWERTSPKQSNPAFKAEGYTEIIPGLKTKELVDYLLTHTTFKSVLNHGWTDGIDAPTTLSDTSIVPRGYDGAIVGSTRDACKNCHQDAGVHVRFFEPNRDWYGFVRGSLREKDLSFHPVDPTSFSANGNARALVLNKKLVATGWIEWVESPALSARTTSIKSPVLAKFEVKPPQPKAIPAVQPRPVNANAGAGAGQQRNAGAGVGQQCNK
jgi:hypothetical protein